MAHLGETRPSDGSRLDSWKEIAVYLKRHVTTVRRWERQEGLPVHRHLHGKLGSVYAYQSEIDEWWRSRQASLDMPKEPTVAGPQESATSAMSGEVASLLSSDREGLRLTETGNDEPPGNGGSGSPMREFVGPETAHADVAFASGPRAEASVTSGSQSIMARAVIGLAAFALGAAVASMVAWAGRPAGVDAQQSVARFVLPIETGLIDSGNLALSPNGAYVAYSVVHSGVHTLHLRDLANPDTGALATIEGANNPFFSPDSEWLGFFVAGKMKKVSVHGGSVVTLADATHNRGATWNTQGAIVYAPSGRAGLFMVSANGGGSASTTIPDAARGETSHAQPYWLPGGQALVYVARGETTSQVSLMALTLADGQSTVLLADASRPTYAAGHLLYVSQGALMAVPFDGDRLAPIGAPRTVVDGVADYAISDAGTLIYAPSVPADATRRLVWVNRQGVTEPINAPANDYRTLRLSPDGTRVALSVEGKDGGSIWTYDFVRETLTRLTFEGRNLWPVWSEDGHRVIYAKNRVETTWDVYSKAADGAAAEKAILMKPLLQIPHSLSRDGRMVAVGEWGPTAFGVSVYAAGESHPKRSFHSAGSGALSPDGRWLAYTSSASGRYEIYVQPTSGEDGKWMISTEGGREPLWAHDGRQLFYRRADQVLAVDIDTAPVFTHGKPRALFAKTFAQDDLSLDGLMYDIAPGDHRFLMLEDETTATTGELQVVVNLLTELRRTVKARRQ